MERVKGIEPSYEAWEAAVLPLNYTRDAAEYKGRSLCNIGSRCLRGQIGFQALLPLAL